MPAFESLSLPNPFTSGLSQLGSSMRKTATLTVLQSVDAAGTPHPALQLFALLSSGNFQARQFAKSLSVHEQSSKTLMGCGWLCAEREAKQTGKPAELLDLRTPLPAA